MMEKSYFTVIGGVLLLLTAALVFVGQDGCEREIPEEGVNVVALENSVVELAEQCLRYNDIKALRVSDINFSKIPKNKLIRLARYVTTCSGLQS